MSFCKLRIRIDSVILEGGSKVLWFLTKSAKVGEKITRVDYLCFPKASKLKKNCLNLLAYLYNARDSTIHRPSSIQKLKCSSFCSDRTTRARFSSSKNIVHQSKVK